MSVLRENRDSLMAVLEAFVHDPLINLHFIINPKDNQDVSLNSPNTVNTTYAAIASPAAPATTSDNMLADSPPDNMEGFSLAYTLLNKRPNITEIQKLSTESKLKSSNVNVNNNNDVPKFDKIPSHKLVIARLAKMTSQANISSLMGLSPAFDAASVDEVSKDEAKAKEYTSNSAANNKIHNGVNERALFVIGRVNKKLTGRDFRADQELSVPKQVNKLIEQATSPENLCQGYYEGWCPFF